MHKEGEAAATFPAAGGYENSKYLYRSIGLKILSFRSTLEPIKTSIKNGFCIL